MLSLRVGLGWAAWAVRRRRRRRRRRHPAVQQVGLQQMLIPAACMFQNAWVCNAQNPEIAKEGTPGFEPGTS